MSTHTTARLTRAGHGFLATEGGATLVQVFAGAVGPDEAKANEEYIVTAWNNHDQIVAENVALREQLARKDDVLNKTIIAALMNGLRDQLQDILLDATNHTLVPTVNPYGVCLSCGKWTPPDNPERHEHAPDCRAGEMNAPFDWCGRVRQIIDTLSAAAGVTP